MLPLTGLSDRDALYLQTLEFPHPLNSETLLWIAVLVSVSGGVLELSRTVPLLLWEQTQQEPEIYFFRLFSVGIVLGREKMGKIVSLWLFVYAGVSFFSSLVFYAANPSSVLLWRQESVSLQAFSGMFGMTFTLPLSSLTAAIVYGIGKNNKRAGCPLSTGAGPPSFFQRPDATGTKEQPKNALPVPVLKKRFLKGRYPRPEGQSSFTEKMERQFLSTEKDRKLLA